MFSFPPEPGEMIQVDLRHICFQMGSKKQPTRTISYIITLDWEAENTRWIYHIYTLYDSLYMFRYYANNAYRIFDALRQVGVSMLDLQPLGTSRFFLEPKMLVFENNMLPRLQGGTLSSAMLQLHGGQGFGIGTCYKMFQIADLKGCFVFLFMLFIPFFCKKNILKLFLLFWLLISFGWCFWDDFLTPLPRPKKTLKLSAIHHIFQRTCSSC